MSAWRFRFPNFLPPRGRRAGWPEETLRKNAETTDAQRAGFRTAVEAGVRIAFGTDAGVYPHGRNAIQFGYMVRLGMTPWQAIRSATVVAADCLGWDHRVGSLAPGRFADLIAVAGDPLADIALLSRPAAVVKGGTVVVNRRP
jgi:imidazolonepropionase-like amidohydrolase